MKYTFILVYILLSWTTFAAEYHVSINGNDEQLGSSENPWASIQFAMEKVQPGDLIYIHEGIYTEPLYLEVNGTSSDRIIFKNWQEDEVIIDGTSFESYAMLEIVNKSYVTIEGLHFRNHVKLDAVGILIEGSGKGIRILDCSLENISFSADPSAAVNEETNAQPLIVYGTEEEAIQDLTITGNEIYSCRTGYSEALAINGNVDGFQVNVNKIHDITNIGIDIIGYEETAPRPEIDQARNGLIYDNVVYHCFSPYASAAGIYIDGGSSIIIQGNIVFENQWGIEVGCENIGQTSQDIIVRNNFVYNNTNSGIQIGGYDYPNGSGKVADIFVINNTLFGNDTEANGNGEIYLSYVEGMILANNIVYSTNPDQVMIWSEDLQTDSKEINILNNNFFSKDEKAHFYINKIDYSSLESLESMFSSASENISINPSFVNDAEDLNLHLRSNSPMIDAGLSSLSDFTGGFDIDGDDRIIGTAIDLGADEYVLSSSVPNNDIRNFPSFHPNPANEYLDFAEPIHGEVEIYNVNGHLVLSHCMKNQTRIDLTNLNSGLYLIAIKSTGKIKTDILVVH